MTRTIRQSEQELVTADALRRIDETFALSPLTVEGEKYLPSDNISVEFRDVSFSYDEKEKALE